MKRLQKKIFKGRNFEEGIFIISAHSEVSLKFFKFLTLKLNSLKKIYETPNQYSKSDELDDKINDLSTPHIKFHIHYK
jgi:hypothetical protein